MRISKWTMVSLLAASALLVGLVACGEEGGDDWTGEPYSVAALLKIPAELDSTDLVALVDGVVSYEVNKMCPGGYYLRDSANADSALYLKDFEPDTSVFPAQPDTFINARVQGSFRPGEKLCEDILCRCQRNLYDLTVAKR